MKHTKLPWEVKENGGKGHQLVGIVTPSSNWFVAEECLENDAAFIVKAVNNHYKLLSVLKHAVKISDYNAPWAEIARIAIEGAE